MTDRPKRPTRYKVDHGETAFGFEPLGPDLMLASEADAYMGYQTELLWRAEQWMLNYHAYEAGCECRVCQLITEIREVIGENT